MGHIVTEAINRQEENKFKFDLADIVLEFNKENAEIVMRQKGMTFHFTRDN